MSSESHSIKLSVEGKAKLKRMTQEVEGSLGRMNRAVGLLAGGMATLAGAGGIGLLISKQVEAAKQADAWSQAIGVNIEALTAWQFAGEAVGLSSEKIADIMKDTSEKIGDAYRNNAGEAKEALQSLNLSIAEMAHLSPDQQLLAIAGALEQVGTQGEKVQIMEALASDASLLLPLLEDNAAELERLTDMAQKTGAVMTREEAETLKQAADNMREMNAVLDGLSQTIAVKLAPAITKMLRGLTDGLPVAIDYVRDLSDDFQTLWQRAEDWFNRLALRDHRDALAELLDERQRMIEQGATEGAMWDELQRNIQRVSQEMRGYQAILEQVGNQEDQQIQMPGMTVHGRPEVGPADVADKGFSEQQQKQLEKVRESLRSQEQMLYDSLAQRQEIVDLAADTGYINEQERLDLLFELNNEYETKLTRLIEKNLTEREKFQRLSYKNQTKTVLGELVGLTAGVAQHNRKLFELNKAAGIANAVVNTYEGVTKTLAKYPWPLSGVMAAAHLAAGLAQVSAIEGASFNGGGAGGAPSLAGSTPAAPVTPVEPLDNGGNAQPQGSQITVIIEGSAIGDEQVREVIVRAIEEAQSNDEIILRTGD